MIRVTKLLSSLQHNDPFSPRHLYPIKAQSLYISGTSKTRTCVIEKAQTLDRASLRIIQFHSTSMEYCNKHKLA